jgi:pimeloyl-ACP methyl ester carboxylesterase
MPTRIVDSLRIRHRLDGPPGAQPPLVLIHGAAGAHYVWLEQLEDLAGEHRMLALDLPGHGGSAAPARPPGIAGHARIVDRLMDSVELGPAVLVGHSMGGAVALAAALAYPERVRGLALLATGARLPVSDLVFGALAQGLGPFGELLAQTAYGPDAPPELVSRYTNGPIQASADTVRADFEACRSFDLRDRLGEIDVPARVLGGDADALVGRGRLEQLVAGLPRARLEILAGAGHMVMQERPREVNAALRSLVREVGGTESSAAGR